VVVTFVIVTFVIVTFVIVTFVIVGLIVIEAIMRRLGLIRLWIVFDCASRTQRCAFQALCAPNKMPEWGINCLFRAKKRDSRLKNCHIIGRLQLPSAATGTPARRG
jgi:hypothetical protein